MSTITIKTILREEEQIKSEVATAIREEIKKLRETNPKLCKKNARAVALLEAITPDQLEIVKPQVTLIKDLQFNLARFYRQRFSDGTYDREKMQNPKTLSTKEIGIVSSIYLINDVEYPKQFESVCTPCPYSTYINFNNEISSYDLTQDIKSRYETLYRHANQAHLYNYPEETTKIILSDWCILESEEESPNLVHSTLIWNLTSIDGYPMKMQIAHYSLGDITLDCKELFTRWAYSANGYMKKCNERMFSQGVIIDFIKGIFGK